jgi:hypothetical protein
MAADPKYAFIPTSRATIAKTKEKSDIVLNRPPNPDGKQDDHSSAFALLKQALISQLKGNKRNVKNKEKKVNT